jgi:CBS domain-containing protein
MHAGSEMSQIASAIMKRDLFTVDPDTPLAEVEWALSRRRISGAPVVKEGKLVGVISRADIVRHLGFGHVLSDMAIDYYRQLEGRLDGTRDDSEIEKVANESLGRQLRNLRARDAMSEAPVTVGPQMSVEEVARTMLEARVHRVIVVDDGRPVGLIASLDLLTLLADGDHENQD